MGVTDIPVKEPEINPPAPYVEKSKSEQTIDNIKAEVAFEDMDAYQLGKFLSVDPLNQDYMKKMSEMANWAKSQGAKNASDIMMKIRDVEVKLGSPSFGEKRIPRIYNYIKLLQKQAEIMTEIKAHERKYATPTTFN